MKIVIKHVYPPIPTRNFDWCAYVDGDEEDGNRYGWGATPHEALDSLEEVFADWQEEELAVVETERQLWVNNSGWCRAQVQYKFTFWVGIAQERIVSVVAQTIEDADAKARELLDSHAARRGVEPPVSWTLKLKSKLPVTKPFTPDAKPLS